MTTLTMLSSAAWDLGVTTDELIHNLLWYAANPKNRKKLEWIWFDHCNPMGLKNYMDGHYVAEFETEGFFGSLKEMKPFFEKLGAETEGKESPYFRDSVEAFQRFCGREYIAYHKVYERETPILMPAELIFEIPEHNEKCCWEYEEDYDYFCLKTDEFKASQRLYKRKNRYIRSIKCSMRNPVIQTEKDGAPVPFHITEYRMELGYQEGEWTHLYVYVAMDCDPDKERQMERVQMVTDEDVYMLLDAILSFGRKAKLVSFHRYMQKDREMLTDVLMRMVRDNQKYKDKKGYSV